MRQIDEVEVGDESWLKQRQRRPGWVSVVRPSRQGWRDTEREVALAHWVEGLRPSRVVDYAPIIQRRRTALGLEHEMELLLDDVTERLESALFPRDGGVGLAADMALALEPFVGFGVGLSADAESAVLAHAPEDGPRVAADYEPAFLVYAREELAAEHARELLYARTGVDSLHNAGIEIRVLNVGRLVAASSVVRLSRPCAGCSVFHHAPPPNSGTFGCLAVGRSGKRAKRLLLLSNAHVLAPHPAARIGDAVVHPGTEDGGVDPADRIARLERVVALKVGQRNRVDAATARVNPKRIDRGLLWGRAGRAQLYRYPERLFEPVKGMAVGKSGRTTGVTRGFVRATKVTTRVTYPSGEYGFVTQIDIAARGQHPIAAPGDSGSVVWALENGRPVGAVGLLFATAYAVTLGRDIGLVNPIADVVRALDIDLYA